MSKHIAIPMILLFALLSGGCAIVPAVVATGASFAVPQTVSLAMTAASTVHKTVLYAADERDTDDIISDKMTTIQAQAMLLDEQVSMDATCLNGDIYLVGEYATPADRDHAIEELQSIKGVNSVKGVVKPMPTKLTELVEPAIADSHAETVIEAGLLAKLHIKSANVDVHVVQGEAVIVGVVEDKDEADSVVQIVEDLRPKSDAPIKITSLLALQDEYDAGRAQPNQMFALLPQSQMLAAQQEKGAAEPPVLVASSKATSEITDTVASEEQSAKPAAAASSQGAVPSATPVTVAHNGPDLDRLSAKYDHLERSDWQNARVRMKRRILTLSKQTHDPNTKKELICLSTKVLKDKNTSIEARLVKTLLQSHDITVKRHVDAILDDIAPQRSVRLHDLAMN